MSVRSEPPILVITWPVSAVTAIGTFCRCWLRLVAVTTTSPTCGADVGAAFWGARRGGLRHDRTGRQNRRAHQKKGCESASG